MTTILTEHGLPARGYRKHTGWKPVLLYIILGAFLSHAQTPNHTLYYGANSNTLGVAFADTTLSISNQTLIVADLNKCLQSGWGQRAEFGMENNDPTFDAHLSYPDQSPFYEPFPDDIVATPNGHALRVSEEVSDDYTDFFAFFATNANIVATGHAFVEFLNSTNFPAIQANDIPQYYLARYKTDVELIANARGFFASYTNSIYYTPSILNFNYAEFSTMPGTNYFYMAIPDASLERSNSFSKTPAIWHDGRWKLMDMQWFIDPNRPQYEVDEEDE